MVATENRIQWCEATLKDVCIRITDGAHLSPKSVDNGMPMASVKDLTSYGINIDSCRQITKEDYDKLVRQGCQPLKGDVLIAKDGATALDTVCVVKKTLDLVLLSSVAILRPDRAKIDSLFLRYYLDSETTRSYMKGAYTTGAAIPRVVLKDFKLAYIKFGSLSTQRKIASILSAYDDLIENNLRRIKILEEMAQNLYREWFVKFRFPGHEQARFVESPLGRIPEGWEVKALGELILEHIGGGWGSDVENDKHTEPAWVIRGTDIPEGRVCNFSKVPFRYHSMSNLKSRRLKLGDIVFEVSGGSKGQPLGRTLFISSELLDAFHGDTVICASFCKRIESDSKRYASELLYLSLLEAYDSGEIEQYQVQSTGISNFKWSDYLVKVCRCVPPVALQLSFCALIAPLFSKVAIIGRTNTNLRRTREMLLPKLISGEVDVSDLDITIPEEAVA